MHEHNNKNHTYISFVMSSRDSERRDNSAGADAPVATTADPTGNPVSRQKEMVSANPLKTTNLFGSRVSQARVTTSRDVPTPMEVTT